MDTTDETEGTSERTTCGAEHAGQICGLPPGHEDPEHPDHAKHDGNAEPLHKSEHASWPVDAEGSKKRSAALRAEIVAKARATED